MNNVASPPPCAVHTPDAPPLSEATCAAILERYAISFDYDGIDVVFSPKGLRYFPVCVCFHIDPNDPHMPCEEPLWVIGIHDPFTEADMMQAAVHWRSAPVPCPEPHCRMGERTIDGRKDICPACLGEGTATQARLLEMERGGAE